MRRGGRSRGGDERGTLIRFGLYNIRNGCNGRLESALIRMDQANMGMGVSQEKETTGGIYTQGQYR